jgi:hypothetical protein
MIPRSLHNIPQLNAPNTDVIMHNSSSLCALPSFEVLRHFRPDFVLSFCLLVSKTHSHFGGLIQSLAKPASPRVRIFHSHGPLLTQYDSEAVIIGHIILQSPPIMNSVPTTELPPIHSITLCITYHVIFRVRSFSIIQHFASPPARQRKKEREDAQYPRPGCVVGHTPS